MQVISRTHVGLVREKNEDALLVREPSLVAVADGMGGYAAGEIASRSTIKAFEAATHSLRHEQKEQNIRKVMLEAFDKANTHVFKMAVSNESYSGMGTTMTALYLPGDGHGYCCHVGDSRLYLISDTIRQITKDHSYVEEMYRKGLITRDSEEYQSKKNIITRALGSHDYTAADIFEEPVVPGDLLLLCSDGLTNMVGDDAIFEIAKGAASLEEKTNVLIEQANENGGQDNISVILASVE